MLRTEVNNLLTLSLSCRLLQPKVHSCLFGLSSQLTCRAAGQLTWKTRSWPPGHTTAGRVNPCTGSDFKLKSDSLTRMINLKGHGNEPNFPGFLHESLWPRSLTLHFEPFRFWLRICGDIRIRKTNDSPYRGVGESTRLPTDTNIFKPLNNSILIVNYIPG